jgi:hypothetical protein
VEESMQITRALSFVLLAVAAGACSSSSSKAAPVLKDFTAPTTASATTVNGQLVYAFTGNLDFSDSAEDVATVTTHVLTPPPNVEIPDQPTAFPSGTQNGPLQYTIGLPADPTGKDGYKAGDPASFTIFITSASGIVSNSLTINPTLQ